MNMAVLDPLNAIIRASLPFAHFFFKCRIYMGTRTGGIADLMWADLCQAGPYGRGVIEVRGLVGVGACANWFSGSSVSQW